MPLALAELTETPLPHIRGPKKEIDFGFVGDIDTVNSTTINTLLNGNLVPVYCALTHDGSGQLLNTNADTIASEIAIGMSPYFETTLYFCFEKKGVLMDITDENSVVKNINPSTYKKLLERRSDNRGYVAQAWKIAFMPLKMT